MLPVANYCRYADLFNVIMFWHRLIIVRSYEEADRDWNDDRIQKWNAPEVALQKRRFNVFDGAFYVKDETDNDSTSR